MQLDQLLQNVEIKKGTTDEKEWNETLEYWLEVMNEDHDPRYKKWTYGRMGRFIKKVYEWQGYNFFRYDLRKKCEGTEKPAGCFYNTVKELQAKLVDK